MKFRLGHADGIDELKEALRLMPEPPSAARARMLGRVREADGHFEGSPARSPWPRMPCARPPDGRRPISEAYAMMILALAQDPRDEEPSDTWVDTRRSRRARAEQAHGSGSAIPGLYLRRPTQPWRGWRA